MMAEIGLISALREIVGRRHVLVRASATRRYRRGYRAQAGDAEAVVRPGSLVELWRVLRIAVERDVVIIVQASNTGLTGGSNPDDRIRRPLIIVSTLRLVGIHLVDDARQIICLPGTTLHELDQKLRPLGREPHSVIGSSCIGASVIGGVCNNSGGSLVRRGPSFTELSLFARIGEDGDLQLVNHLDIDLMSDDPETMLTRLEAGNFAVLHTGGVASDTAYSAHVRDIGSPTPARFNADKRRLHEASGSAGRIVVFAVRLDTFPRTVEDKTFYIGTNSAEDLTKLRRILLSSSSGLPVSAEYIHREAFDTADLYGRDTVYAVRLLGTKRLPHVFAIKARLDALGERFGRADISEHLLQWLGRLLPDPLPVRLREWRRRYEHHLILKVDGETLASVRNILHGVFPSPDGNFFECDAREAAAASLHRFVTAGAAIRYSAMHRQTVAGIVALDVALPRNADNWFAPLAPDLKPKVVATLRYGHFLCHVFHRDYLIAKPAEPAAVKARLLADLDSEGAEYPAEHNVGRQYNAKPTLVRFYRALDPTNRFNPGIGKTPTGRGWTNDDQGE